MKKSPYTALVSTTPFRRASFARLPGLLGDLGPVKAPSIRVASRGANTLRAGYPAHSWEDLADSRLLLVAASADKLAPLLNDMLLSLHSWKSRSVVLIDSGPDSRALEPVARCGAQVASVHLVGDPVDPVVLLEGDSLAVGEIRRRLQVKPLVIRKGTAALAHFAAAQVCLALPALYDTSLLALRHAGLNPAQSWRVLETLVALSLRSYRKSGRRAWKGSVFRRHRGTLGDQLEAFNTVDPVAAAFLRKVLAEAFRRIGRDSVAVTAAG